MIEIEGDIWNANLDVICVTTNGVVNAKGELIMGKGIAKQASDRLPDIRKVLGAHVLHSGNVPKLYRNYPLLKETHIISLPTKNHWKDRSDIDLIENSIKSIVDIADTHPGFRRIGMTRPGCGNGGLNWELVKSFIKPYLDDRFLIFDNGGKP